MKKYFQLFTLLFALLLLNFNLRGQGMTDTVSAPSNQEVMPADTAIRHEEVMTDQNAADSLANAERIQEENRMKAEEFKKKQDVSEAKAKTAKSELKVAREEKRAKRAEQRAQKAQKRAEKERKKVEKMK